MRIAWIVPGGVDRSGRERVIPVLLWLIEILAARHKLHVFALWQYPEACSYPLLGATIHNLKQVWGPFDLQMIRQFNALRTGLLTHGPFDIIHGFWPDRSGFLAASLGKTMKIPTLVSLMGGELTARPEIRYGSQLGLRGRIRVRLACRWAGQTTAATRYMCDLAHSHGIDAQEIPLGVHPDWINTELVSQAGPPWRLLHVASLNRVKDQRTLLLAVERLVAIQPQTLLDIVGEDTLGGEIQKFSDQLGLSKHVFFHGFMPNDQTRPFFQSAHLLLLPSRHDAGPLVMLEAAACGLVTVASCAVGYASHWHPRMALAVPVGDPQALADASLTLLNDPTRRRAMGIAAQNWVKSHDSHWTAEQFERLYRT